MNRKADWIMTVYVLLMAVCFISATKTTTQVAKEDINAKIDILCRNVLSDPLDSSGMGKLAELRKRSRLEKNQALDGLIYGLEGYVDGNVSLAEKGLSQAVECEYVRDFANTLLLKPLEKILKSCKGSRHEEEVCSKCGDTGWVNCEECLGVGWCRCRNCKGTGEEKVKTRLNSRNDGANTVYHAWIGKPSFQRGTKKSSRRRQSNPVTYNRMCTSCSGKGAIACTKCSQKGVVLCPRCRRSEQDEAKKQSLGTNELDAIKRVIAMACYLRDGGIDVCSSNSFKASPQIRR